jgi:hypothetical protein
MTLGRETCVMITEGDLRHDYGGRPASRLVSRWRGRPALMTLGRETCVTITEGDLRHDYIMHNYEEGDLR